AALRTEPPGHFSATPARRLGPPGGNGPHGLDLRPRLPRSIDAPTRSSYLFLAESPRRGFRPVPALPPNGSGVFLSLLHCTTPPPFRGAGHAAATKRLPCRAKPRQRTSPGQVGILT